MVHVKSRLRRSEPVMNHGYICACVFGSWVDTVYDVYETVTFMYVALSSRRWVTTKVLPRNLYSILFTIYNRPRSDHEISRCCLHFKRNVFGCIDTKIFYTGSFHWVVKGPCTVLYASNLWSSEFLSNLPYIFHPSRLFFLPPLLFFSSPLSTFLNAVLPINHLCCTHYCRNFYRCS